MSGLTNVLVAGAAGLISLMSQETALSGATSIDLTIGGISTEQGHVLIALYDSADAWNTNTALDTVRVPASDGSVLARFDNIPSGDYAIAVFHDANDDGQFNIDASGIPLERYAFSNNVFPQFRRARFDEAAFEHGVADTETALSITLRSVL